MRISWRTILTQKPLRCRFLHPISRGVLRADVDPENHAVTIDFVSRVISDESLRQVAEKLARRAPAILQDDLAPRRARLWCRGAEAGTEGAEDRRHPARGPPSTARASRRASHRARPPNGREGEALHGRGGTQTGQSSRMARALDDQKLTRGALHGAEIDMKIRRTRRSACREYGKSTRRCARR